MNNLSLVFNSISNFMDAKLWFDGKSKYAPDTFNSIFRSFDFECKSKSDVNVLESELEKELVSVGFDNFYFESYNN